MVFQKCFQQEEFDNLRVSFRTVVPGVSISQGDDVLCLDIHGAKALRKALKKFIKESEDGNS